jgi:segregation and condensation protein B
VSESNHPEPAAQLASSYGSFLEQAAQQADGLDLTGDIAPADAGSAAPPPLVRIVEALLFVGGSPLTAEQAGHVVRGLAPIEFANAVQALNREYQRQGRPYTIGRQGDGFLLTLRPRYGEVVDRLYGQGREARLSPAAIDVLALVAYRQPVTKMEIDSIRGLESGALLRQLVRRGLIAVTQRAEAGRREVCYGTTKRFLELFQLSGLDDLPQTQDLQRL